MRVAATNALNTHAMRIGPIKAGAIFTCFTLHLPLMGEFAPRRCRCGLDCASQHPSVAWQNGRPESRHFSGALRGNPIQRNVEPAPSSEVEHGCVMLLGRGGIERAKPSRAHEESMPQLASTERHTPAQAGCNSGQVPAPKPSIHTSHSDGWPRVLM